MASRPQFSPTPVIPSAAAVPANSTNMAANITSAPTIVQKLSMISYHATWAGAVPVGVISVEASNNYALNADGTVKNAGTWVTIPLLYQGAVVQSVPVTGNTGDGIVDIDAIATYAIRLVYTATSGTGALTVIINAKVA